MRLLHWDFSKGRVLQEFSASSLEDSNASQLFNPPLVHALSISPAGDRCAAGLGDGSVMVVNFGGRHGTATLSARIHGSHRTAVGSVHWTDDDVLISGGNDARISVWSHSHTSEIASTTNIASVACGGKVNKISSLGNCLLVATTSALSTYQLFT